MTRHLRVAGAQVDLVVGDVDGNTERILATMAWAEGVEADVLLLPELAVTGYPPEDLLLRDGFVDANLAALERLASASGSTAVVVGFVDRVEPPRREDDARPRCIANAAAVLAGGRVVGVYHKVLLPNYGVFDEARYFVEGPQEVTLFDIAGVVCGVSICEDIWSPEGPPAAQARAGAQVLLNINGSPYHVGKGSEREALLREEAVRDRAAVVYLNLVGGQDELVFDGDSMVFDHTGTLLHRAVQFEEERFVVDVPVLEAPRLGAPVAAAVPPRRREGPPARGTVRPRLDEDAEIYAALVTGLRDYVEKNGFPHVVVGMSGGIDSSLTAVVAVDALGADRVWGVTMPSRYSSEGSVADSRELAERLGIRFDVLPIEPPFAAFLDTLEALFSGTKTGVAEENLQARIRGTLLMALTNKFGGIVVSTGNKSEMAVGYATLYGDMVGGYAVLKDVYKTRVYRLARWRNRRGEVIPASVLTKPPSAELRPDQKDTDSLPPYDLLDRILERYVERDETVEEIVAAGFDEATVRRVARMIDRNEYKRRQAPPGVKITEKAFGRDRRLPITNRFRA